MQLNQDAKPYRLAKVTSALAIIAGLTSVGAWYYFVSDRSEPIEIEPISNTELLEKPLPITSLPAVSIPESVPVPELQPVTEPIVKQQAKPQPEIAIIPSEPPIPVSLPELSNSDTFAFEQLAQISEGMQFTQAFKNSDLIRRFVVWLDNLAIGKVLREQGPFTHLENRFPVLDIDDKIYLDPTGYHRYDAYAQFITNLDPHEIAKLYRYTNPLLKTAFEELGYESDDLNQMVIHAIDELLLAPEVTKPMELITFSVNYKFADKELEDLTDAQKMMIRMGPDNSKKVKNALRQLKEHIKK